MGAKLSGEFSELFVCGEPAEDLLPPLPVAAAGLGSELVHPDTITNSAIEVRPMIEVKRVYIWGSFEAVE